MAVPITLERDFSMRVYADEIGAENVFSREHVKNAQAFDAFLASSTPASSGNEGSLFGGGSDGGGGGGGQATARVKSWTLPANDPVCNGRRIGFNPGNGDSSVVYNVNNENTIADVLRHFADVINGHSAVWLASVTEDNSIATFTITARAEGVAPNAWTPGLAWIINNMVEAAPATHVFALFPVTEPFGAGARLSAVDNLREIAFADSDDMTNTTLQLVAEALVAAAAGNGSQWDLTTQIGIGGRTVTFTNKTPGASGNAGKATLFWNNSPEQFGVNETSSTAGNDAINPNAAPTASSDVLGAASSGGDGPTGPCAVWIEIDGAVSLKKGDTVLLTTNPPPGKKAVIYMENVAPSIGDLHWANTSGRDAKISTFIAFSM